MKKLNRNDKKTLPGFVLASLILLIIIGFASKDKLNQYLSSTMIKNAAPHTLNSGATFVDSAYNYSANGLHYETSMIKIIINHT